VFLKSAIGWRDSAGLGTAQRAGLVGSRRYVLAFKP